MRFLVTADRTTLASLKSQVAERGQVTLFGIGLVVVLLFVGGLSLDLWRVFSERRALAEVADAAAAAGADGIDVAAYRDEGVFRLDPTLAEALAVESIGWQAEVRSMVGVPTVTATTEVVVVEVRGEVEMTMLRIFTFGEPFEVRVQAEAAPRRGLPE